MNGHDPASPSPAPTSWASAWADARAALERSNVRHAVLRDPGEVADRSLRREIDLLVHPDDLAAFERAVAGHGFVPLAAWGRGGHRFYVAYLEAAGEWLKLDVVTTLRFGGRTRPLATGALAGSLARRVHDGDAWRLDLPDAVLALMLHGILDKRTLKPDHRRELLRARAVIDADATLAAAARDRFATALGGALPWREASDLIADERWDDLTARRRRIVGALVRRDPVGSAARRTSCEVARVAHPFLIAAGRRGFSVALLGPDGAGKTSLARALAADGQMRARIAYMGSNLGASTIGLPTTRWLGRRGRGADGDAAKGLGYLNRLAEQGFRSLVATAWGLRGRFVVFDRHPRELLIADPPRGLGARIRRLLLRATSTRPDLVLLLDAPPDVLRSRKGEHSLERIERQRQRYRSIPLGGDCLLIDASAPPDQVARRVKSAIWTRYRLAFRRSS